MPHETILSPPSSPNPITEVEMPNYIPDQSDNIENNTNSLLYSNQMLHEGQQEILRTLSSILEKQQSGPNTSELERFSEIVNSILDARLSMSNSTEPVISPSSTVPATPQSPNIELPSSFTS